MYYIIYLVAALALVGLGLYLGITLHRTKLQKTFDAAQEESETILAEAQTEREQIIQEAHLEAKKDSKNRRTQFEIEAKKRKSEISKLENKIKNREQSIANKLSTIESKEAAIEKNTEELEKQILHYKKLTSECENTLQKNQTMLEQVANMSQEEAKRNLLLSLESQARKEAESTIRQIEEDAREEGERRAQSTVSLAVQRVSSDYVNDSTVTVVGLPSDEMKGRIIGREGRNIRAIEQATGVDLIIDDTPEAIILSCFNPVRREIAKLSIGRLIADGRIHPARIDETVKKVTQDFDQIIMEGGEQAAFDTGITDLHPELLSYLGRLKYRTAGQQTVLQHAVEVAHICGIMAGELGTDIKQAKRCGLLHDIGKAVDQETEGHHALIGAQLCRKHNESSTIVEAIESHHSDQLAHAKPLTVILHSSNTLSASRPGARKEILETYVKRLRKMESLVSNFSGIDKAFIIQAGREIRAMVQPAGVNDEEVTRLSSDIAFKLRKEMTFPGQVKVTVLRESKYIDYAK